MRGLFRYAVVAADGSAAWLRGKATVPLALDQPGWPGWHPGAELTPLEQEMRAKAAAGDLVDQGAGPFDLAGMQGSAIRAAVLRYLLTVDDWPVDTKGLRLRGVRISGQLDLEGATLRSALFMECCHLDADKPVCLDRADVPRLTLTRCQLAGLTGEMLSTREVDLSGSTLTAPLNVLGADITGQLICHGTKLTGRDEQGNALIGDRMKVGGDVLLDGEFTAAGTISIRSARVGGSVDLHPEALAGQDETALDAAHVQITGQLVWAPDGPVSGRVDLEGATVGHLVDDWNGRHHGFWPTGGRLRLGGFTYDRFGGAQQATVKQRLEWIRSQYRPKPTMRWTKRIKAVITRCRARGAAEEATNFTPGPYEQLAAVYRRAGQDSQARQVAIARRRDLRRYGSLAWYLKVGNWFLQWSIGYGYRTWRAGLVLSFVFAAVAVLAIFAQQHHLMVPVGDTDAMHFVPSAAICTSNYPCFSPVGYAVDTVIPLISVHQADYWGPNGHTLLGHAWGSATRAATVLGWALVTLLLAGFTGLVRRD